MICKECGGMFPRETKCQKLCAGCKSINEVMRAAKARKTREFRRKLKQEAIEAETARVKREILGDGDNGMLCESCEEHEAGGYQLDDLQVCLGCYIAAIDHDYEQVKDRDFAPDTNQLKGGKE